jgi:alkanesulfonate monooxygenase SsuD/methylene tetrahydromethanopterin reductase-like flavin-dependent oxidoreductase (luciferase family)
MTKLATEIRWMDRRFRMPVERVQLTERLGYDAVFTAEGTGSDALTPLGYLAAVTKRINLGTHVASLTARPPTVLAQAFQTIDAMAGGDRVIVGLGNSLPSYGGMAWPAVGEARSADARIRRRLEAGLRRRRTA